MKFKYLLIFLLFIVSNKTFGQNPTLNIGPDRIIPTCQTNNDTIFANLTGNLTSTSSYNVIQNTYNPYPYVGTSFLTSAGNFGNIIDDQWSNVLNLPFSFCFFNNSYTQYLVSLNGQIGFDLSNALQGNSWTLSSSPIPNNNIDLNNTIMGAYYDIYPFVGTSATSSISTATYGVAPNRVFVLSFNANPMFNCTSTFITQQIVLHETSNIIDINIQNKNGCTSWVYGDNGIEGIQNSTGSLAYTVPGRNSGIWTATNDSWSFVPNGANVTWFDDNNIIIGTGLYYVPSINYALPGQTRKIYAVADFYSCGVGTPVTVADTMYITKQQPITFTINSITDANCFDEYTGAINFNANGGSNNFSYTLNGNPISNNPTGLHANTYTIIATDAYNCSASTIVMVGEPTKVNLSSIYEEDVLCKYQNNGKIHVEAYGGIPPYLYMNGNSIPKSPGNYDTLIAGIYKFYTTDSHGCIDSIEIEITQPDSLLTVDLLPTIATCINKKDGTIDALASGGNPSFYTYEWTNTNPIQTSQMAIGLETGAYNVVVTDANGCIAVAQTQLEQELCCQLFMPDAFTPNGDLHNDTYRIIERGGGVILGEFRIYNRYGQEVFSTRDISKGWDGNFKGKEQNSDTYHYILQYQCNDKGIISPKIAKGSVILIR